MRITRLSRGQGGKFYFGSIVVGVVGKDDVRSRLTYDIAEALRRGDVGLVVCRRLREVESGAAPLRSEVGPATVFNGYERGNRAGSMTGREMKCECRIPERELVAIGCDDVALRACGLRRVALE